ncbi:hypothetical protein LZ554_002046 [Drepanopeziza brunnea f. sp. 'monogermtubi']|nr:hypothetical protein LZ554_002046 [Drepanopeziza brunnea f. sp. 'monogermtubi']
MAAKHEPDVSIDPAVSSGSYEMQNITSEFEQPVISLTLPAKKKYRQVNMGKFGPIWYASPKVQLLLVALVCFLCPGMFNALGGLGGGGRQDPVLVDHMNTALYSTFAVFGFFGGTFVNVMGVKWTLAIGGSGYCIYSVSLLISTIQNVDAFNISSGALLGICAGLLWTAQGTIMTSYPHENAKGRYFACFWAIFNMGAVVGSLIPLAQNIDVRSNTTVNAGTYIAFIVLMGCGSVLALLISNARDVIREDGTRVVLMQNPTWQSEFVGLWETFSYEPSVVLLFPMFWSSNWFYTYQQNGMNGIHFDTRTKALNSCLYFMAQIFGALGLGYALDYQGIRRSVRAKLALAFLFVMTMVIWGGGYAYQKGYTRATVTEPHFQPTDWTDTDYPASMVLYIFYGFYDALWQAAVYWFMGALSNSGRRTANYIGFYKGIQSAGAAVMWSLDARKVPLMDEFLSNWILLTVSLILAIPVIFLKIKDHTAVEEDLVGTDETLADVLPTGHPKETDA